MVLDQPDMETWAYGHGFDLAAQEQWTARFGGREFSPNRLWINGDKEYVNYDFKQYDCKDHLRTNIALTFLAEKNKKKPFSYLCHIVHLIVLRGQKGLPLLVDKGRFQMSRSTCSKDYFAR